MLKNGKRVNMSTGIDSAGLATPQRQGGQSALERRLAIDPDIRYRAITGAVLWAVLGAIALIRELVSGTDVATSADFYRYTAAVIAMSLLCLFVGPRLRGRPFRVAEELVVINGWLAIAGLVYVTGGSASADIGLFAGATFYCAYFMSPLRAVRQIALGTIVMWLPLYYQSGAALDSDFVLRASVMTAVLWVMAGLISRNRLATRAAELKARRMALTDPLTGVANLRTFDEETRFRLARAAATDRGLGVAFIDVNGLKAANTVHGHEGGDQLIKRTASALLAAAGERDQVARVGGDEFAVLVSGASPQEMHEFEARFAIALSEQREDVNGPLIELSASIGSATFPQDGASFDQLMDVADGRMFDSKAALPTRLPTPGTAGGRALTVENPDETSSRLERALYAVVPTNVNTWLLAGTTILAAVAVFATGTSASPILFVAALLRYNSYRAERAEKRVLELAHTDMLTGLANRRVFESTLAGATREAGGGLILADVDNFKAINSSGGHRAGDEVLRLIASVLDGASGPDATLCRIGGDEFAVILSSGDSGDVMRAAAKCRAAIGAVDWHVLCEPELTLSFGYASWKDVESWKDIVIAADGALSQSKQAGKDRVSSGRGQALSDSGQQIA